MQNNAKGIYLAILATGLFSISAVMAKTAADAYHILQILFFRQLVVFASSLPALARSYPIGLKTQYPGIHGLRILGAFVALSCSIWAVSVLPLSTAVTLSFVQTFFVALLAVSLLGETIGLHRIMAILAGFVGVVIVMQPSVDSLENMNTFIPLVGALGAAVAVVCVRKLTQTESTATLLLYQSVFVGLMAGVPLFWFWATPNLADLGFLIAMGCIAALAQWLGIMSLRHGEANVVSTIKYSDLLFAAVLGFMVFGEIPAQSTILGGLVITGSALYLLHREKRAR